MKNIRKRVGICNNILSQEISFKVICGRSLILISIRHQQICQMSEVYEYVRDIASLFQPMRYGLQDNPMGLYSDYESFKKHFVRYWKNALDISRADLDEVRIFLMMFYPLRRVAKIELLHQCFLKTVKHLQ